MSTCHTFRPVPGQCGPNRRGPLPAPPFDPRDYWATRKLVSSLFGSLDTTKLDRADVVDPGAATESGKAADAKRTQEELDRILGVASDAKELAESKADKLSSRQLAAVNSGIDAGKVARIAQNESAISAEVSRATNEEARLRALISAIKTFEVVVADSLPSPSEQYGKKLYLVPSTNPETRNVKDEFICVKIADAWGWEQVGSTAVTVEFDDEPTEGSQKAARSGGIWSWVKSLLPSWLTPSREVPPTQESVSALQSSVSSITSAVSGLKSSKFDRKDPESSANIAWAEGQVLHLESGEFIADGPIESDVDVIANGHKLSDKFNKSDIIDPASATTAGKAADALKTKGRTTLVPQFGEWVFSGTAYDPDSHAYEISMGPVNDEDPYGEWFYNLVINGSVNEAYSGPYGETSLEYSDAWFGEMSVKATRQVVGYRLGAQTPVLGVPVDALKMKEAFAEKRGITDRKNYPESEQVLAELLPVVFNGQTLSNIRVVTDGPFAHEGSKYLVCGDVPEYQDITVAELDAKGMYVDGPGATFGGAAPTVGMQIACGGETGVSDGDILALTSDIPAPYIPDHTDPTFSNAVLFVGLDIDTNSVAVLNEIAATFGGFPIEGTATTVGGLLAALAAAAAWLKRNKVGSFESVGGASATVENGVAKLGDFFTESNSLLTGLIAIKTSGKADQSDLDALAAKVDTANAALEEVA